MEKETNLDMIQLQSIEATHGVTTEFLRLIDPLQLKLLLMNKMRKSYHYTWACFPIIARSGGTLIRAGHTEAIVDIANLWIKSFLLVR